MAHTTGAMFQFVQRYSNETGLSDPFQGLTLSSQIGQLPDVQKFYDVGASFGWNMSGINNNTTIRNALKYVADQWGAAPLYIGAFVF